MTDPKSNMKGSQPILSSRAERRLVSIWTFHPKYRVFTNRKLSEDTQIVSLIALSLTNKMVQLAILIKKTNLGSLLNQRRTQSRQSFSNNQNMVKKTTKLLITNPIRLTWRISVVFSQLLHVRKALMLKKQAYKWTIWFLKTERE